VLWPDLLRSNVGTVTIALQIHAGLQDASACFSVSCSRRSARLLAEENRQHRKAVDARAVIPHLTRSQPGDTMLKIIFACVHNAGRSQMAAAFFNQLADRTKAEAVSAGTEPALRVHPEVLAAMQEIGIDLSAATPQKLTQELANDAALLITMGCGDKCPYVPGLRRDDWPLHDPKGRPMDEIRAIRGDIKARVTEFIQAEGVGKNAV
jgi:arsenate reductase